MAVSKKVGFELEQLIARQIYNAAMKLPDAQSRIRALGHVSDAIVQAASVASQEAYVKSLHARGIGPLDLSGQAGQRLVPRELDELDVTGNSGSAKQLELVGG